jgi:Bacterial Ig-like domain
MLPSFKGSKLTVVSPCAAIGVLVLFILSNLSATISANFPDSHYCLTTADAEGNFQMRFLPKSEPTRPARTRRLYEQLESRLFFSAAPVLLTPSFDQLDNLLMACSTEEFGRAGSEQDPFVPSASSPEGPSDGSDPGAPMAITVNAGTSSTVEANKWLQLNGTVLGRKNTSGMQLQWSKLSGPGNALFSDPTAANSRVQFSVAGAYVLQLRARANGSTVDGQLAVAVTTPSDTIAPTITNRSPGANATGVARNAPVTVTFSEAMNGDSINTSTVRLRAVGTSTDILATVTCSGTTATLQASSLLNGSTTYQVTIAGSVTDEAGNALGSDSSWNFTTISADTTAPTVTNRTPGVNATGVARNAPVTVTFSEAMNAATINTSTVRLRAAGAATDVLATVSYSGTTATLQASTLLNSSTTYQVTVAGSVTDAAGNALGTASTWNFTTVAVDTTAPTITNRTPGVNATNTALNGNVSITFSEAMNAATINASTVRLRAVGASTDVLATVSYSGTTATLQATSPLSASTTYQVTVAGSVTDTAGNALGTANIWSFTTGVASQNVINIDQAWLAAQGVGPYYLNQQGMTYRLQTDVSSSGTAFAIVADNVTLDLNGHTVTYNNSAPIVIPNASFESGSGNSATGWNFSNAPNATRYQGIWLQNEVYDGQYSLRFGDTTQNEFIESTGTVTLEANTTYSLSAMIDWAGAGNPTNPGAKIYVQLLGTNLPMRELAHSAGNNRGIQLREAVFTTGNTTETYHVRVGIEGHLAADKPFYIDDLKIQQTNTYGVAISPKSSDAAAYPGLTQFGSALNATVRNGVIIQGADGATWGHGIYIRDNNAVIHGTTVVVNGANASAIAAPASNNLNSSIFENTLTSNVRTITSRDNFNGAVLFRIAGSIHHNTITNGPQSGIVVGGDSMISSIYNNTIELRSRYTNSFAIRGATSSQIFNNVIRVGTGDYTARGIMPRSGTAENPSRIYNNEIHVQALANNQEYGGVPLGGTYGIQVEEQDHIQVYNNDVTAYGTTLAYALRITGAPSNTHIHHNTFRAVAGSGYSAALSYYITDSLGDQNVRFEDNTLVTNEGLIGGTRHSTFTLARTHIVFQNPLASPRVFNSTNASDDQFHTLVTFLDPTFEDTTSRDIFRNAGFQRTDTDTRPENRAAFQTQWSTTLQVRRANGTPAALASIVLRDRNGVVVLTTTADANGRLVVPLTEFRTQGATKTLLTEFSVTAMLDDDEETVQFDANQVQTIIVDLP